jgi:glutamate-1-semialdehyde aminotransferase
MVQRLNNMTDNEGFPIRFTHFGSFFSIALSKSKISPAAINRLSYDLLFNGIFLRGGDRGGFLTTSHSDQDIDQIVETWMEGIRRLAQSGFLVCDSNERASLKI